MHVLEAQQDLGGVELGPGVREGLLLFGELLLANEEGVKLPAWAVLQDEVQLLLVLEGGVHVDDERVAELT